MNWRGALIAAALSTTCLAAPPRLPPPGAFAAEVLAGRLDMGSVDFSASGYWSATPDEQLAWRPVPPK